MTIDVQIQTVQSCIDLLQAEKARLEAQQQPVPLPPEEPWPLGVLNPNFSDGTDWPHPNYKMPLKEEMWAHWAEMGSRAARVSFRWEAIQPVLDGPLDPAKLADMLKVPEMAARHGMVVLWNMHNYNRRNETGTANVGTAGGPTIEQLASFYAKFAREMMIHPNVVYGLMNEPKGTLAIWKQIAQACVDSIRGVGDSRSRIAVGGVGVGHAHNWPEVNGTLSVVDPVASGLLYECHQYCDADSSGTFRQTFEEIFNRSWVQNDANPLSFGKRLTDDFVDEWLIPKGFRGILGETGVPSAARWRFNGIWEPSWATREFPGQLYRDEWVEVLRQQLEYCKSKEVPVFLWMDGIHAEANALYIGHKAPDNPIRDMLKSVLAS